MHLFICLYFYIFSISEFDQRSVWFYVNADQKRGCLSLSDNTVNSHHNVLLRTFDCDHEKGRRSQAKEGWENLRTSAMRCRRTDEAGNKIKEKKKRKEGGREFAEVVLDESKRSFSCFSTGIYNTSHGLTRKCNVQWYSKMLSALTPFFLSLSHFLFRHRSADRFFLIIRFNVNLAKNKRCVDPTS